mmetsp:Transcript_7784/g.18636  ORF Transcript_7784/g.18636 Transcript_7784/m.18636 type:complete len:536 (-) Transcript_7784:689-2296(-)|eukprot:CAMPEP_0177603506 /NCGR_PEP_ID=MMETSP0419_2-20121207/15554_1 /TAXON_ID=582737 /ORGANISM="Tetraselmis sp., Strain GSL018" /LENGTH=535 /DNA_ID=CAMNT_0019097293 /DNA_START=158 /DNA_END=1765 /DNA_ORIENTATION=+
MPELEFLNRPAGCTTSKLQSLPVIEGPSAFCDSWKRGTAQERLPHTSVLLFNSVLIRNLWLRDRVADFPGSDTVAWILLLAVVACAPRDKMLQEVGAEPDRESADKSSCCHPLALHIVDVAVGLVDDFILDELLYAVLDRDYACRDGLRKSLALRAVDAGLELVLRLDNGPRALADVDLDGRAVLLLLRGALGAALLGGVLPPLGREAALRLDELCIGLCGGADGAADSAGRVDREVGHEQREVAAARLEQLHHVVHRGVLAHDGEAAEGHVRDRHPVLRVDADELLHQDDADDVVPIFPVVNGDAAVPCGEDLVECRARQDGVGGQHEDLVDWGHRLLGDLCAERERALHDGDLLHGQVAAHSLLGAVDVHKLLELGAAEHCRVPLSEDQVEELGDGPRDGGCQELEGVAQRRARGADVERVVLADRLRDDLAHDEEDRHAKDDGYDRVGHPIDHERQRLSSKGVAQEERDEEVVLILDDRDDPLRAPLLMVRPGAAQDLKVNAAHAQEAEGETTANPGKCPEAHADREVDRKV